MSLFTFSFASVCISTFVFRGWRQSGAWMSIRWAITEFQSDWSNRPASTLAPPPSAENTHHSQLFPQSGLPRQCCESALLRLFFIFSDSEIILRYIWNIRKAFQWNKTSRWNICVPPRAMERGSGSPWPLTSPFWNKDGDVKCHFEA